MSFTSLLAVWVLAQLRPPTRRNPFFARFTRYAGALSRHYDAGEYRNGVIAWLLAVSPPVAVAWLVYALLAQMSPLLPWAWNVAVLYFALGLHQFSRVGSKLNQALRAGDSEQAREILTPWSGAGAAGLSENQLPRLAVEHSLWCAYRHLLGVVVWFVLLPGPSGAVLYRLADWLADAWNKEQPEQRAFGAFARQLRLWLDWLPSRLAALSFAVVGNFEDALYCWRTQAALWPLPAQGIVLASAAGALGVKLGGAARPEPGAGDEADVDDLQSAVGLVWRVWVMWLLLLLLFNVAQWVG